MANILESESTTLLVPGIAGIGKTALSAKLLERFTHRRNLLYHRCQDWEGSRAFLEACSEWLAMIGNNDLSDYVSSTPVPQVTMAVNIIVEGLQSRGLQVDLGNLQLDIEKLKEIVNDNTAGLMLTNPNTGGLFEEEILTNIEPKFIN